MAHDGFMAALACSCCGTWRVESINLDGRQRLKVTRDGFIVGYCRTVDEVKAELARRGGPDLAEFEPCGSLARIRQGPLALTRGALGLPPTTRPSPPQRHEPSAQRLLRRAFCRRRYAAPSTANGRGPS